MILIWYKKKLNFFLLIYAAKIIVINCIFILIIYFNQWRILNSPDIIKGGDTRHSCKAYIKKTIQYQYIYIYNKF